MEWLTNLLGMTNSGSSPFGALGGGSPGAGAPSAPSGSPSVGPFPGMGNMNAPPNLNAGAPGTPMSLAPPNPGGAQPGAVPGLLGQMMNRPQNPGTNNALLGQAFNMMKQPQMQPMQWMNMGK